MAYLNFQVRVPSLNPKEWWIDTRLKEPFGTPLKVLVLRYFGNKDFQIGFEGVQVDHTDLNGGSVSFGELYD